MRTQMVDGTPLQRLGEPDDIAIGALCSASPAGSFVTGKSSRSTGPRGPEPRSRAPRPVGAWPDADGQILFCDLVGPPRRRARLGDDAFDASPCGSWARCAPCGRVEGRDVSTAGDGLMVVFPDSVADGLECATSMYAGSPRLDDDDPPRLRIGISTARSPRTATTTRDADRRGRPPRGGGAPRATYASDGPLAGRHSPAVPFRDVGIAGAERHPRTRSRRSRWSTSRLRSRRRSPRPAAAPRRSRVRAATVALLVIVILVAAGAVFASTCADGEESADDLAGSPRRRVTNRGSRPNPARRRSRPRSPTPAGDLVVPQDRARPDEGPDVRVRECGASTIAPIHTRGRGLMHWTSAASRSRPLPGARSRRAHRRRQPWVRPQGPGAAVPRAVGGAPGPALDTVG